MQMLLVRSPFTIVGVRRFEKEVNELLSNGWELMDYKAEKRPLRFFLTALLANTEKPELIQPES